MGNKEYVCETLWGETFKRGEESIQMSKMIGRDIYNKTRNKKGVLRCIGQETSRGGHGEGDFTRDMYALVTSDYDVSHIYQSDVIIILD